MKTNFFSKSSSTGRRRRLVTLTRRAYFIYISACYETAELETSLRFDDKVATQARNHRNHLLNRYSALEAVLADESGVSKSEIFALMASGTINFSALVVNLNTMQPLAA